MKKEDEILFSIVDQFKKGFDVSAAWKNEVSNPGLTNIISPQVGAPSAMAERVAELNNTDLRKGFLKDEENDGLRDALTIDEQRADREFGDGDGKLDLNEKPIAARLERERELEEEEFNNSLSNAPTSLGFKHSSIDYGIVHSPLMHSVVDIANNNILGNDIQLRQTLEVPKVNENIIRKSNETNVDIVESYDLAVKGSYEQLLVKFDDAITSNDINPLLDEMEKNGLTLTDEEKTKFRDYWKNASPEERKVIIEASVKYAGHCQAEELGSMEENAELNAAFCKENGVSSSELINNHGQRSVEFDAPVKLSEELSTRVQILEKQLAELGKCLDCDTVEAAYENKLAEIKLATDGTTQSPITRKEVAPPKLGF